MRGMKKKFGTLVQFSLKYNLQCLVSECSSVQSGIPYNSNTTCLQQYICLLPHF